MLRMILIARSAFLFYSLFTIISYLKNIPLSRNLNGLGGGISCFILRIVDTHQMQNYNEANKKRMEEHLYEAY